MQKGNDQKRIGLIRPGKKIVSLAAEKEAQLKKIADPILELLPLDQSSALRAVFSLLEQDNPKLAQYSPDEIAQIAKDTINCLPDNPARRIYFFRLFSAIFRLGQLAGTSSGKDSASENMERGRLEGKRARTAARQVYYDEIRDGLNKGEGFDGVVLEVFEKHRDEGEFKTTGALKSFYYRQEKSKEKISS